MNLNILPPEILHKIFTFLIIHLDYNTLKYMVELNKEYKKIIIKNVDINTKIINNIYIEKEHQVVLNIQDEIKLNKLIINKNTFFKKEQNRCIYISFFDSFITKKRKNNIYNTCKKIVMYYINNVHWNDIKRIYLICTSNINIVKKYFDGNELSKFIFCINNDEYIKLTLKNILENISC